MNIQILIIAILFIFSLPLYSLEVHFNGELYRYYSDEELEGYFYNLPDGEQGMLIEELLPYWDLLKSFTLISDGYRVTSELKGLLLNKKDGAMILSSPPLGELVFPDTIEIHGTRGSQAAINIWIDRVDPSLMDELKTFSSLKEIDMNIRIVRNMRSRMDHLLEMESPLPDLLIFNQERLPSLSELLKDIPLSLFISKTQDPMLEKDLWENKALPFKMSQPLLLREDNEDLKVDLSVFPLYLPLLKGLSPQEDDPFSSRSLIRLFDYLTELGKDGIIEATPTGDGAANYLMSSELPLDADINRGSWPETQKFKAVKLPTYYHMTLLAVPEENMRGETESLIIHLRGFGSQQRIRWSSRFTSIDHKFIPGGERFYLSPVRAEQWRNKIPQLARLVLAGRLTTKQAMEALTPTE